MKKNLSISAVLVSTFIFAQTNTELKNEIDKIKIEINGLKSEILSVKSENIYLKKMLDINKPILEAKNNGNEYRITKIVGNRKEKTITVSLNIEATDETKTLILQNFSLIDLAGNQYSIDFKKTGDTSPTLNLKVPLKMTVIFKDIIDEPKIIKLFKFQTRNEPVSNPLNFNKSVQEFKDLNVVWE